MGLFPAILSRYGNPHCENSLFLSGFAIDDLIHG